MSVFHGNWSEDPKEFLRLYLQCTAAGGDNFRARQFINYLGANSEADEWFEELPQEEKKDWEAIELSFRKKWLKEEVLSISKTVTIENEPQVLPHSPEIVQNQVIMPHEPPYTPTVFSAPTEAQTNITSTQRNGYVIQQLSSSSPPVSVAPSIYTATNGTQTEIMAPQQLEIRLHTCVAMPQPSEIPKSGKNSKTRSTSKKSLNLAVLSSPTPSLIVYNSPTPSTTTPALETRQKTANFYPKVENDEVSPNSESTKTTPQTLPPGTFEHLNNVARAHTSLRTLNDVDLRPLTHTTTVTQSASSSESSQPTQSTEHQKSVLLRAVFESQLSTESPVSTTIVTALKTRPESTSSAKNYEKVEKLPIFTQKDAEPIVLDHSKCADNIYMSPAYTSIVTNLELRSATAVFMKNHQKSPIFIQNDPESLISGHFNWEINTESLPTQSIAPTKHPCDLSSSYFSW